MASSKSRKSASSVATEVVSSSVPDQVTDQDIALINELTTPDNVDALEGVLEAVVGVAEATNHVETLDPIVSAILNDPETSQPSTEETANTDQPTETPEAIEQDRKPIDFVQFSRPVKNEDGTVRFEGVHIPLYGDFDFYPLAKGVKFLTPEEIHAQEEYSKKLESKPTTTVFIIKTATVEGKELKVPPTGDNFVRFFVNIWNSKVVDHIDEEGFETGIESVHDYMTQLFNLGQKAPRSYQQFFDAFIGQYAFPEETPEKSSSGRKGKGRTYRFSITDKASPNIQISKGYFMEDSDMDLGEVLISTPKPENEETHGDSAMRELRNLIDLYGDSLRIMFCYQDKASVTPPSEDDTTEENDNDDQ